MPRRVVLSPDARDYPLAVLVDTAGTIRVLRDGKPGKHLTSEEADRIRDTLTGRPVNARRHDRIG